MTLTRHRRAVRCGRHLLHDRQRRPADLQRALHGLCGRQPHDRLLVARRGRQRRGPEQGVRQHRHDGPDGLGRQRHRLAQQRRDGPSQPDRQRRLGRGRHPVPPAGLVDVARGGRQRLRRAGPRRRLRRRGPALPVPGPRRRRQRQRHRGLHREDRHAGAADGGHRSAARQQLGLAGDQPARESDAQRRRRRGGRHLLHRRRWRSPDLQRGVHRERGRAASGGVLVGRQRGQRRRPARRLREHRHDGAGHRGHGPRRRRSLRLAEHPATRESRRQRQSLRGGRHLLHARRRRQADLRRAVHDLRRRSAHGHVLVGRRRRQHRVDDHRLCQRRRHVADHRRPRAWLPVPAAAGAPPPRP